MGQGRGKKLTKIQYYRESQGARKGPKGCRRPERPG